MKYSIPINHSRKHNYYYIAVSVVLATIGKLWLIVHSKNILVTVWYNYQVCQPKTKHRQQIGGGGGYSGTVLPSRFKNKKMCYFFIGSVPFYTE